MARRRRNPSSQQRRLGGARERQFYERNVPQANKELFRQGLTTNRQGRRTARKKGKSTSRQYRDRVKSLGQNRPKVRKNPYGLNNVVKKDLVKEVVEKPKRMLDKLTWGSVVEKATQTFGHISEQTVMWWRQLPTKGKVGIGIGAAILAFGAFSGTVKKVFNKREERPIPKYYNRGYNLIKEQMTDFGSPVDLVKTVSKVIAPYKSAVRMGVRTNVNTIMRGNAALSMARSAIGHMRY